MSRAIARLDAALAWVTLSPRHPKRKLVGDNSTGVAVHLMVVGSGIDPFIAEQMLDHAISARSREVGLMTEMLLTNAEQVPSDGRASAIQTFRSLNAGG